jgi:hypothetical protein
MRCGAALLEVQVLAEVRVLAKSVLPGSGGL